MQIHTYIYIYIYTHTYTYVNTYIYTYIQSVCATCHQPGRYCKGMLVGFAVANNSDVLICLHTPLRTTYIWCTGIMPICIYMHIVCVCLYIWCLCVFIHESCVCVYTHIMCLYTNHVCVFIHTSCVYTHIMGVCLYTNYVCVCVYIQILGVSLYTNHVYVFIHISLCRYRMEYYNVCSHAHVLWDLGIHAVWDRLYMLYEINYTLKYTRCMRSTVHAIRDQLHT
jgi:hypothetical protein